MPESSAKRVRTRLKQTAEESGFVKFTHAMLETTKKQLVPDPEEVAALGKAIRNHLFDFGRAKQIRSRPFTMKEVYFNKIFFGFTEIYDSIEMLKDILFLVGEFPYSYTRISPDRHLQFLIEAYFGEIYLLQERLKHFLTVIDRQFKTDPRHAEINNILQEPAHVGCRWATRSFAN
jgi:hypothetical protein